MIKCLAGNLVNLVNPEQDWSEDKTGLLVKWTAFKPSEAQEKAWREAARCFFSAVI